MLEVRVLGALAAEVDGQPITLPADARARELLAWLAVAPGLHPRSALAGRLRPDVAEDSARKTLRDAVYELRRALGPAGREAVIATREHVGLREDGVRVDLWDFRRLRSAGQLEAAVAGRERDLLTGIDSDWVLRAREQHAAELADALATLAKGARAAGDLPAAIGWTRRRVEVEPLAENAHRELIRLLSLAADRPAALAAAEAWTVRLRRELGVPPSAATRALIEDVRRGRVDSSRDETPSPSLPAPLARTQRPKGREAPLTRLNAAWTDACSAQLRLTLITGQPGIGKTTLAGELGRRVYAQGAAILHGRSDEHALVPYQPWVEALECHLAEMADAEVDHWLTVHDGVLARLLPARGAGRDPPGESRERYLAFESVRDLLEHTAARRPLVLVLDDLQWADQDSLALVRHLARAALRARVLVVLCAREAELTSHASAALGDLRREGPLVEVALGGLDDDAVAELLAHRTGTADPESARRYRQRTGGNPFLIDALLRDEQGRGDDREGPPPGVRDVISRRLSRLDTGTCHALALAAVLGLEFDLETVSGADGRTVAELLEALDGAVAAGLIEPTGRPGRYAFEHALVGETIVSTLSASRRARLHLQVADALADRRRALGAVPAGEVVRHLRGAAPLAGTERLASWELTAAREATAALAHAEAAGHWEAALAALPRSPERGEWLLALGDAQDRAGRRGEARRAFTEAAAVARADADAELLASAGLGYGGLAVVIASPDPETTALLEEAIASVSSRERSTAARLRARLAVELYYTDSARTRELSERAVADARASGEAAALAAALNARRVALWDPGHAAERLGVVDEMVLAAESAGDREAALQGRNWRVADLWELGRMRELAAEIDDYDALAETVGLPHYRWYVPLWRAALAIVAGRWEDAAALSDRAQALGRQADDPNAPLLVSVQRQLGLAARRRFAETDREWAWRGAAGAPSPAPWLSWLALIDAATGRKAEAQAVIDELTRDRCAALPMNANWHAACELADAVADLGDRAAAAALHARLAPHAALFPLVARGVCSYSSTEHYLGRLAATLGHLDEAEVRLRRAVAANDHVGAGPYAAITLTRLGEVLIARGEHDRARETLADALTRADALQMPALAGDAGAALQRLDR